MKDSGVRPPARRTIKMNEALTTPWPVAAANVVDVNESNRPPSVCQHAPRLVLHLDDGRISSLCQHLWPRKNEASGCKPLDPRTHTSGTTKQQTAGSKPSPGQPSRATGLLAYTAWHRRPSRRYGDPSRIIAIPRQTIACQQHLASPMAARTSLLIWTHRLEPQAWEILPTNSTLPTRTTKTGTTTLSLNQKLFKRLK
jgi:hypothetical protein